MMTPEDQDRLFDRHWRLLEAVGKTLNARGRHLLTGTDEDLDAFNKTLPELAAVERACRVPVEVDMDPPQQWPRSFDLHRYWKMGVESCMECGHGTSVHEREVPLVGSPITTLFCREVGCHCRGWADWAPSA